ncbi:MAG: putative sulfate/molybdate transporter [Burkholderiales bacterium]|nr:putative sulfate/molybdate transporter [Burkholderiales bacterium]
MDAPEPIAAASRKRINRFDRMEWAGAGGDLGTLIPFVVAYIGVLGVDPHGMLLAFGVAGIVCGLVYRTPFPVQPMKAIGAAATTQAAQTLVVTAGAVYAAGIATGVLWLLLALTGAVQKICRWVGAPVVTGIVLGLGLGFMLQGVRMMSDDWWLGAIGLGATLWMLSYRAFPAMFLLLALGAAWGIAREPVIVSELLAVSAQFRPPSFALGALTWNDWLVGCLVLALPQLPLTLGNAVIAITDENNRLFPDRAVSERRVAASTGLMNLIGAAFGGVPMCHGAGGMAGHVRFGARTGGAAIILGTLLVLLALFFADSVQTLLRIFPTAVLGVILFLTGAQLALGACDLGRDKGERFAALVTAGCALWNVGLAFVVGLAVLALARKGRLHL